MTEQQRAAILRESDLKRQVFLLSAPTRIQALKGTTITPLEHDAHFALVDSETELVEADIRSACERDAERARVERIHLEERLTDVRAAKTRLEPETSRGDDSRSLVMAVLNFICVPLVAYCEFGFALATLTVALDIDPETAMGAVVAMAPVLAFFAMKEPIDRFVNAASTRAFTYLWRSGDLNPGLGGLHESGAERSRASRLQCCGDLDVVFDQSVVDRFSLALSVLLVILGAVFLSHGFRYGRAWLRSFKARLRLRSLGKAEEKLADKIAGSKGREVELATDLEERPRLVAELWRKNVLADLAGVEVRSAAPYQQVDAWCGRPDTGSKVLQVL